MAADDSKDKRLDKIVENYLSALQQPGAEPSSIRRRLAEENSDLGDELVQRLKVVEAVFRATGRTRHGRPEVSAASTRFQSSAAARRMRRGKIHAPVDCPHCGNKLRMVDTHLPEVTCGSCGSVVSLDPDATVTPRADVPESIGEFEITGIIGEGGFGTAYRGIDSRLGRIVAIKVPRAGYFLSDRERQRFVREAKAAARLRHPNIVQVHQISEDTDPPFIVSDFIDGFTLSDEINARRLDVKESARILIGVADATHFAHENNIIHRDLKPGNILLDQERHPYVTDFGLARHIEGEVTMTVDGEVLGTPAYMSPEQAEGRQSDLDRRTDIYSLGVILYRMIAGELPFGGSQRMLLLQVINDEPRPPRSINAHAPIDLETIALKAMEKDPARRYSTAKEFGADIRRWLDDEPILARPISYKERLLRWRRRHPDIAHLLTAIGALLIVIAGMAVAWAIRETALVEETRRSAVAAQASDRESRERLVRSYLNNGVTALRDELPARSLTWLAEALTIDSAPAEQHRRRLAMVRKSIPLLSAVTALPSQVNVLGTADNMVLAGTLDGTVHPLNPDTRLSRTRPWVLGSSVLKIVTAPKTNRAAVVVVGNRMILRDLSNNSKVAEVAHDTMLTNVAFNSDGSRLATAGADGLVHVLNAVDGQPIADIAEEDAFVSSVIFLPDDQLVVVTDLLDELVSELRIVSADGTEEVVAPVRWGSRIQEVRLTADGSSLLLSGSQGDVGMVSVATGEVTSTFNHEGIVLHSHQLPDAAVLSVSKGGLLSVWRSDGELRARDRFPVAVLASALDPDNRLLAVGGIDGRVAVYIAGTLQRVSPFFNGPSTVKSLVWQADSRRLTVGSADGLVRVWDLGGLAPDLPLLRHNGPVVTAQFDPSGHLIATASSDNTARLWNAESGEAIGEPLTHDDHVTHLCFSRKGDLVATSSVDQTVKVWNTEGQGVGEPFEHESAVLSIAFSPVDDLLVSGTHEGTVRGWRVGEPDPVFQMKLDQPVMQILFSADGAKFGALSYDSTLTIYDGTGNPTAGPIAHPRKLCKFSFSPDGTRVATCCEDRHLRIWKLNDVSQPELDLLLPDVPTSAQFPESGGILSASRGGAAELWNGDERLWNFARPQDRFSHVDIDATQKLALVCGERVLMDDSRLPGNGLTVLLDLETGLPLAPPFDHFAGTRRAFFNPSSNAVLTSSYDHSARIWKLLSDDRSPEAIRNDAIVMSGQRMDEAESLTGEAPESLVSLYEEARSANPELYRASDSQIERWSAYVDWICETQSGREPAGEE